MPKTRNDLAARALALVGAVPAGQAPSAEDMELATNMIAPTLSELAERRVLAIDPEEESIDDPLLLPLARILAEALSTDFGVVGAELDQLQGKAQQAEGRLREMQIAFDAAEPIKAQYF